MPKKNNNNNSEHAPETPAATGLRSGQAPARRRAPAKKKAEAARSAPTQAEIAEAAYYRHLKRGGTAGNEFNDWVEAERELRQRSR